MTTTTAVIIAFWLLFYGYWAISAIGVKRNIRRKTWWVGLMMQQFPNEYPAYKKRTEALIPLVW
jgi:hypothetical protein